MTTIIVNIFIPRTSERLATTLCNIKGDENGDSNDKRLLATPPRAASQFQNMN